MRNLFPLLVVLLLAVSCGSEDEATTTPTSEATPTPAATALSSQIQTIAIRPASFEITGQGESEQLTLDVYLKDGSVIEGVSEDIFLPGSESDTPMKVEWSTENFGIAVVSEDGFVTSVSSGETMIKARLGTIEAESRVVVASENSLNPNIDTALPPQ